MRTQALTTRDGGPEGPPYDCPTVAGRAFRPGVVAAALILCAATAFAQFQMPDPKEMSGIPRPVTDLPDNTVSVRVIRGSFDNNVAGQDVEMRAGGETRTTKTDQDGRAEFSGVAAGTTVRFTATVDGETLESQEFPFPGRGGVRLMLVATDPNRKTPAAAAAAEPIAAPVVLSDRSRIVLEPDDEVVRVYYLLEILNTATAPANPPEEFAFDLPDGAAGAGLLEGTSPLAQLSGTHVRVPGPFPPGPTVVQVGAQIAVTTGTLEVAQSFPAALQQVAVIVRKLGNTTITSPQITNQQEFTEGAETYVQAVGPPLGAGTTVALTLTNLPHHSATPRRVTLGLSALIVALGLVFGFRRPAADVGAQATARKRLIAKRDKLFAQLVRLEGDHRGGRGDAARYAARREELVAALERIYGELDQDDAGPDPSRAGLAA
jgi:hypothetical protein